MFSCGGSRSSLEAYPKGNFLETDQLLLGRRAKNVKTYSIRAPPDFRVGPSLICRITVIRVYDIAGNVIETHRHNGDVSDDFPIPPGQRNLTTAILSGQVLHACG